MIDKIKPAEERIHPMALDDKSVWCNAYFDEVVELRAAYEALQKENAAQAKRIADLEETNGLLQTQVHCLEIFAESKNGYKP